MNKRILLELDYWLLIPTLILCGFSLATLFSLSFELFRSQLIFLCPSLVVFCFFSQFNTQILKYYATPIYVVSVILLLLVLLLGIESRGAVRWIDIFGIRIQFSEILKPFLALAFASFLLKRKPTASTLFLATLLVLPILFMVYRQPDLGNAIIFAFAFLFSLLVYGVSWMWFIGGFLLFLGSLPIFWGLLHEYQRQRVLTFVHPSNDPLGTSYNAMQSIIAVGSGMLFGRGIGEGTQSMLRFLPERHTDFIFATLSEGFGFVTALLIVLAFSALLYRIYIIGTKTDDVYCRYFSVIAFAFLFVQCFINIGMNIGILPITGVTLPFVSYGGSSLLANFIFLGLLSAMSQTIKAEGALEIR